MQSVAKRRMPRSVTSTVVVAEAAKQGVLLSPWNASRVRAVTHLDADATAVARAGGVVREVIERLTPD